MLLFHQEDAASHHERMQSKYGKCFRVRVCVRVAAEDDARETSTYTSCRVAAYVRR